MVNILDRDEDFIMCLWPSPYFNVTAEKKGSNFNVYGWVVSVFSNNNTSSLGKLIKTSYYIYRHYVVFNLKHGLAVETKLVSWYAKMITK